MFGWNLYCYRENFFAQKLNDYRGSSDNPRLALVTSSLHYSNRSIEMLLHEAAPEETEPSSRFDIQTMKRSIQYLEWRSKVTQGHQQCHPADNIADDLEWPLNVISSAVNRFIVCMSNLQHYTMYEVIIIYFARIKTVLTPLLSCL